MNRLFPHMTDSPDRHQVLGGLCYGIFPFVVLPFTLMLFIIGIKDTKPYLVLEFLYQAINFIALFAIFQSYLQDSWFMMRLHPGKILGISLKCALLIIPCYLLALAFMIHSDTNQAARIFLGVLPVTGIELMLLPGQFALFGGIPAILFLVFLGPITNACLYYATAFAPLCSAGRRLAAYLCVAVLTAVPRIITYFTVWGGWKEPELYLAQLPIHLFSCWLYQKTNTIWAPIFTHGIVNAVCCAILWGLQFFGYIL